MMKRGTVCIMLCVVSGISWTGATPIGNHERNEGDNGNEFDKFDEYERTKYKAIQPDYRSDQPGNYHYHHANNKHTTRQQGHSDHTFTHVFHIDFRQVSSDDATHTSSNGSSRPSQSQKSVTPSNAKVTRVPLRKIYVCLQFVQPRQCWYQLVYFDP